MLSLMPSNRVVRIGVDSCSSVSAWPVEWFTEYPTVDTEETGREYFPAADGSAGIKDQGKRTYRMRSCTEGKELAVNVRVARVRKPLLSVADMNDVGLDVHFLGGGRGAYAENPTTGERLLLERRDNVFELVAEVLPFLGGLRQAQP